MSGRPSVRAQVRASSASSDPMTAVVSPLPGNTDPMGGFRGVPAPVLNIEFDSTTGAPLPRGKPGTGATIKDAIIRWLNEEL